MEVDVEIGLVGLGEVHHYHASALDLLNGLTPRVVHDKDASQRSPLEGVHYCESLDELLESSIDAVVISTTTGTHYDIAVEALKHGKHVLLEKPATTSVDNLSDLKRIAAEHQVQLVTAFHDSFGSEVIAYNRYINPIVTKELGNITEVQSTYSNPYYNSGSLSDHAQGLKGAWLDAGSNALSVICSMVKNIDTTTVSAEFLYDDETKLVVKADAEMKSFLPNEVSIVMSTDWTTETKDKTTRVRHADGTLYVLDHIRRTVTKIKGGQAHLEFQDSTPVRRLVQQYCRVLRAFRDHVFYKTDNVAYTDEVHSPLFAAISLQGV
jgi:predicted dehydrogenase